MIGEILPFILSTCLSQTPVSIFQKSINVLHAETHRCYSTEPALSNSLSGTGTLLQRRQETEVSDDSLTGWLSTNTDQTLRVLQSKKRSMDDVNIKPPVLGDKHAKTNKGIITTSAGQPNSFLSFLLPTFLALDTAYELVFYTLLLASASPSCRIPGHSPLTKH